MSLLPSVTIQWLLITSVLLFGPNIVFGVNASSNATKVCCPPFDKSFESNGTVFCFARIAIPNDRATIGNYLCRNLHPHAKLASFHSGTEVAAVYPLGLPGVTGLVYEFDEFSWRDGTPVDFTQWYSYQPSMNSSEAAVELGSNGYFNTITLQGSTTHNAFCKMEAEHTECSDCESCMLRRAGQSLFCYRFFPSHNGQTAREMVDDNVCAKTYPGYDVASIHSKEENDFIVEQAGSSFKYLVIGLRIPPSKRGLPLAKDLFEWTDGTPFDYDNWENSTSYSVHGFPANANELTYAGSSIYKNFIPAHNGWPEKEVAVIYIAYKTWINANGHAYKYVVCKKSVKCPYHMQSWI